MATYISLLTWTEQGIANIKDSPKRLNKAKKMFKEEGATLKDFYLTVGSYDMICVTEAPNDETVARLLLRLGATGSVRTTTLRAFNEKEYRSIIDSV